MSECYYICFSREVREMGGRQRTGLEFEIVQEKYLNCFLGRENKKKPDAGNYEEAFESFLKYGMSDERFHAVKGRYLGTTGFLLLTVYFDNIEYARYRYENWYCIELADREHREALTGKVYDCAVYEWGEAGDPEINAYGSFQPQSREETRLLRQLYRPYIPPESRWDGNGLKTIGTGTVFGEVLFYYVGAALCVEIHDNSGNLAAFFDLGTRVSQSVQLANRQPQALNSQNAIFAELRNIGQGNQITIFISHWHADHCNALGSFFNNGALAGNIAQNTEWYVPGSARPVFQHMQKAVPPASFHVVQAGAACAPVNINGNTDILAGKINYAGNLHPHHQGVYAMVRLAGGTTVLLTGDTTYEGIPMNFRTNGNIGYDCLQVCHHGGNYHYAPANLSDAYIPQAANHAIAVYSADGIYHAHPNGQVVSEHRQNGYLQQNEGQLQLGADQGYNIFSVT